MTCVIALKQNNKIYMGADSLITDGNGICHHTDNPLKLLKNDRFLLGFCGSFKIQNKLINFDWSTVKDIINFAEILADALDNISYILLSDGKYLTHIAHNGWNNIIDDYYAIGSGYQIALGSLFSTKKINNPLKRINIALNAAEEHCGLVKGPFIFEELTK